MQVGASGYLSASAEISTDGRYRYSLSRQMKRGNRAVLFIGLNPSTAEGVSDDPTLRRCVGFARSWDFDWLLMGNLHALRSTDPRQLLTDEDPTGPENDAALRALTVRAELVVAAWGANWLHPTAEILARWVVSLEHTRCLGQNRDGSPRHPLYLGRQTPLSKVTRGHSKR